MRENTESERVFFVVPVGRGEDGVKEREYRSTEERDYFFSSRRVSRLRRTKSRLHFRSNQTRRRRNSLLHPRDAATRRLRGSQNARRDRTRYDRSHRTANRTESNINTRGRERECGSGLSNATLFFQNPLDSCSRFSRYLSRFSLYLSPFAPSSKESQPSERKKKFRAGEGKEETLPPYFSLDPPLCLSLRGCFQVFPLIYKRQGPFSLSSCAAPFALAARAHKQSNALIKAKQKDSGEGASSDEFKFYCTEGFFSDFFFVFLISFSRSRSRFPSHRGAARVPQPRPAPPGRR